MKELEYPLFLCSSSIRTSKQTKKIIKNPQDNNPMSLNNWLSSIWVEQCLRMSRQLQETQIQIEQTLEM